MGSNTRKTFKPSTYQRKISDLSKIIGMQEKIITVKDTAAANTRRANKMLFNNVQRTKKINEVLQDDYEKLQKLYNIVRTKYNKSIVELNLVKEDLTNKQSELLDSETRCEELADRNQELLQQIDDKDDLIEELQKEISEKEKLTEGEYEKDKPN